MVSSILNNWWKQVSEISAKNIQIGSRMDVSSLSLEMDVKDILKESFMIACRLIIIYISYTSTNKDNRHVGAASSDKPTELLQQLKSPGRYVDTSSMYIRVLLLKAT